MKFLKTKNISKWSVNDQTIIAYPKQTDPTKRGNRVVMNATGGLLLPKGTTAQQPKLSGDFRQPTDANGTIRYNTSLNPLTGRVFGIEAYVDGNWEIVRAPGSATILKQQLGPGDGINRDFYFLNGLTVRYPDNIIVLVENVFQISVDNFNLGVDYTYLRFTSPVPVGKYVTVYIGFAN
jgi:hypothetical protein